MELLRTYKNGNYNVAIFNNGTKIRSTIDPKEIQFIAEFPENVDIKITNKCDLGCEFCHEASTIHGKNAKLFKHEFFNTLIPGTELAIGGGNIFETNSSSTHSLTMCTKDEYKKWKDGIMIYSIWYDKLVSKEEEEKKPNYDIDEYKTYDQFFDKYEMQYDCFEQEKDNIVAFGYYGND